MLLNQLATPGLGSLLAGRRVAGTGQLLLALAGFVLVIAWFGLLAFQIYGQLMEGTEPKPVGWLGLAGAGTFAAAWLWSLVTSLSILREARANERKLAPPVLTILLLGTLLFSTGRAADARRFVIDDEQYVNQVISTSATRCWTTTAAPTGC